MAMPDIEVYLADLIVRLRECFAERLVYVGLHGSFQRGEADENSDIDVMVTLDVLSPEDLVVYRDIVFSLPFAERSCGFISGRHELACWPAHEVCLLLHETKDYYGSLKPLLPVFTREDVKRGISIGVGNLYHALCHGRVHAPEKEWPEVMKGLYKGVFFILQNIRWYETGEWVPSKAGLLPLLEGLDREVFETALALRAGAGCDYEAAFGRLLRWCGERL